MFGHCDIYVYVVLLSAFVFSGASEGVSPEDAHEYYQSDYYSDTLYNLGDLFNMPSYSSQWSGTWPKTQRAARLLDKGRQLALQKNQSLLAFYYRDNNDFLSPDARYPNVSRLRLAVGEFGRQYIANNASPHFVAARKNSTLLVHVRSGDIGNISTDFVQCVLNLSVSFDMTILMGGVHANNNKMWLSKEIALNNFAKDMHHLVRESHKRGINAVIHYGKNPDADLYLMSIASNLLLHRGGYSALGGLLNSGKTFFYSDREQFLSQPEYYQYLRHPNRGCLGAAADAPFPSEVSALANAASADCVNNDDDLYENVLDSLRARQKWSRDLSLTLEEAYDGYFITSKLDGPNDPQIPYWHGRFNLVGPVGPKCRNIESFGTGDEEKRVCGLRRNNSMRSECTIFSIGSNNQWNFEESIFKTSECIVHVFDCTVARGVEPPAYIRSRVTLYKVCIGDKDYTSKDSKIFSTWESLLKLVGMTKAPTFLKMDVEGWEYPVLRQIVNSGTHLPLQIGFELHYHTLPNLGLSWGGKRYKSPGELAVFMDFLYRYGGYHLVDRNDNRYCGHCTELLVVRFCAPL